MRKFFTSKYSTVFMVVAAIIISISINSTAKLQFIVAAVGMAGLLLGMTKQMHMQYVNGKCGVHWMLNSLMFFAITMRAVYMVRTGQYWLAIPDIYGSIIMGIIQLQLAGFFLKKQTAP